MYAIDATLVLDLGNSETRGKVLYRVGSDVIAEKFTLSNRFSKITTAGYEIPEDYTEAKSTIFALEAEVDGDKISGEYVNGILCDKEFSNTVFRPSSLDKKHKSLTTALSFAEGILIATKIIGKRLGIVTLSEIDINWNVVSLLPPAEMNEGASKLEDIFRSIKLIDCVMPVEKLNVKVNKVKIYPEGFCAFIGTIFNRGYKIRQEMKKWLGVSVLVLDIGAGTTDIMVIDKTTVIDNSKDSLSLGGNQVTQKIKAELRRKRDLALPDGDILEGVISGKVMDGFTTVDITDIVQSKKSEVAEEEVQKLREYFETTGILPRTIAGVLTCGGGSLGGKTPALEPLSKILIKFIKNLAPNSELLPLPKDTEGNEISARDLNLEGASILAELM